MFINEQILKQYGADDEETKYFSSFFPNGAELVDVLSNSSLEIYFLHWLISHFTTTNEEKAQYLKTVKIECDSPRTVFESDNVTDSSWVSRSSNIKKSEYIFSSQNITSSSNILLSEDVINSSQIFGSEFIYSSKQILHSKNITNSNNIVCSDYVVNSHSVMNSAAITNSAYVDSWSPGGTKQIKNCRFIMDCQNLKNSLFCHKICDKEYMMFNQKIDEADYLNIIEQLDSILERYRTELVIEGEWPFGKIPLDTPRVQRNIIKQYSLLPSTFWRWVKTLPGYDPSVLYAITYKKDLI